MKQLEENIYSLIEKIKWRCLCVYIVYTFKLKYLKAYDITRIGMNRCCIIVGQFETSGINIAL